MLISYIPRELPSSLGCTNGVFGVGSLVFSFFFLVVKIFLNTDNPHGHTPPPFDSTAFALGRGLARFLIVVAGRILKGKRRFVYLVVDNAAVLLLCVLVSVVVLLL